MSKPSPFGLDAIEGASDGDADRRCAALIGRTMLQASAMLPLISRESARQALEVEAERLAAGDREAAERALKALDSARAVLARALADARMADEVSCAIVNAADVLGRRGRPRVS